MVNDFGDQSAAVNSSVVGLTVAWLGSLGVSVTSTSDVGASGRLAVIVAVAPDSATVAVVESTAMRPFARPGRNRG